MKRKVTYILIVLICGFTITIVESCVNKSLSIETKSLDFIMDMVHNNPGEEAFITKYNDPEFLRWAGFNSMVPHWQINCAITYDNFEKDVIPKESSEYNWIEKQADEIEKKLIICEEAGIDVYPFTDFVVFPESIIKKYGDKIINKQEVRVIEGSEVADFKPDMQSEYTRKLIVAQVEGIFDRFPQLDGLTLRFGETYLHDTPFHRGGSPIKKGKEGIEDHITLINLLKEELCVKRNKKLFYRTWDFGHNFHTNPEYYLAVTNKIEPHPNLFFSIKYQQGDFHRMTPFNPCIGIGKHKQIIESQSRMEAYGKGAHPYYSAFGVINGWPETKFEIDLNTYGFKNKLNETTSSRGIKDIIDRGLLAGIVTWSHGGGWRGPYIKHEIWTDLNTYVVSQWGINPDKTEKEIFYEFASKLGLKGYQAALFRELNLLTIEGVRKGHCNSYASNSLWWTRDQYFSVSKNAAVIKEILENGVSEEVLAEKAEASAIWNRVEAISKQIKVNDSGTQEAIEVSCTYGRIKYELIEQMWNLMIEDALGKSKNQYDIEKITKALDRYDQLWAEWAKLKASSSYCATIYTDMQFLGQVEGSIGELIERLKSLCSNDIQ